MRLHSVTAQEMLISVLQKDLEKGHVFYAKFFKGRSVVTCYLSLRPGEKYWTYIRETKTNGQYIYTLLNTIGMHPLVAGEIDLVLPLVRYGKHSEEYQDGERILCEYYSRQESYAQ